MLRMLSDSSRCPSPRCLQAPRTIFAQPRCGEVCWTIDPRNRESCPCGQRSAGPATSAHILSRHWVFRRVTPHTTRPQHHTETETQREDRERRKRKGETERRRKKNREEDGREGREDKTRQDETEERRKDKTGMIASSLPQRTTLHQC